MHLLRGPQDLHPIGNDRNRDTLVGWAKTENSSSDGSLVEASSDKTRAAHLDVTPEVLTAIHVSSTYLRGWTDTYDFRVLAVGDDGGGDKVRWTDGEVQFRGYILN